MAHTKNNLGNKPLEIICVACPKGCRLGVQRENGEILVTNAGCKHGREYAVGELNDPRRMLASTVRVHNGLHPLVPVYTEAPFPKALIPELLQEMRYIQVSAPIKCGQVVIRNALKTGINVLASRNI